MNSSKIALPMVCKRVSPYQAILPLFFCRKRYVRLAIQHNMAIELESPDRLEAFKNGTYPRQGWEQDALQKVNDAADIIRHAIWSSFVAVAITAVVAIAIAFSFGKVAFELPLSWPKLFSLLGGFLAAWATLMELGGFIKTYSGQTLPELIHPVFFRLLFIPGTLLVMVGLLW